MAKLINPIKAKESLLAIISNVFMKVQTIILNYNCQYLCSTAIDGLASIHLILSITSLDEVFKRM